LSGGGRIGSFAGHVRRRARALAGKTEDTLVASIDLPKAGSAHPAGKPIEVTGWAFFADGPAHFLEGRLDGRMLVLHRLDQTREDVLAAYPQARAFASPVGFQFLLDLPRDTAPGPHTLQFVVQSEGSRRKALADVPFELIPQDRERSLSARFAEMPSHLVAKVNGSLSEIDFVNIGDVLAGVIAKDLPELGEPGDVLDFGCGLGRILRAMLVRAPHPSFTGFDIDPMMLEWCDHLLHTTRCRFTSSTLSLGDDRFRAAYVISVFTHLSTTTDYWLAELHRVLTPGGRAFITYHDETLFEEKVGTPEIPGIPRGTKLDGCRVVGDDTAEGGLAMGTYYTTRAWEELLSRYFTVEKSVPRGILGYQSFSVVTKKAVPVERSARERDYIRVLERELFELRKAQRTLY
jgi:SAM-dependent methyltransferase